MCLFKVWGAWRSGVWGYLSSIHVFNIAWSADRRLLGLYLHFAPTGQLPLVLTSPPPRPASHCHPPLIWFSFKENVSSSKRPQSKILKNFEGSRRTGKGENQKAAPQSSSTKHFKNCNLRPRTNANPLPHQHTKIWLRNLAQNGLLGWLGWLASFWAKKSKTTRKTPSSKRCKEGYMYFGFGFSWVSLPDIPPPANIFLWGGYPFIIY